jgi:hypothetical protein
MHPTVSVISLPRAYQPSDLGDYLRRPVIGITPVRFMLYQALPR